jgi:integrase/recombinase XerD
MSEILIRPNRAILPLEQLELFAEVDGSAGSNRAETARPLIAANNDIEALKAWLARVSNSKPTFDSYRKEAERLLLWAVTELGKPISSLCHEDLLVYQRFLENPQPASRWVMTKRKVGRADKAWRPFAGPLSPASQRQAIVILNSMFSWLVNAGYLAGNPLALSRQRQRKSQPRITRFLDDELWSEVKLTIESMPRETERECEHYHRVRWLFALFYLTGIRVSEVVINTMGSFFSRSDRQGEHKWWLEITGKGNKTRLVPATQDLMVELERYRREVGLMPLPIEGERTPLLLPIGGKHRFLTRAAIHIILKQVFIGTAARLQHRSDAEHQTNRLMAASAHWMRHTAGSNMANGMDIRYVRDNLGHESINTTNIYLHTEEDQRHAITEEAHKLNW